MSNWQPLESNSELITNYMRDIGLDTTEFVFQDLLSYEEWAQEMIKKPVLGLLYIYEITAVQEKFRKEEEEILAKENKPAPEGIFYMKQYAENACGTIGCFHILGNLPAKYKSLIKADSLLAKFFEKVKGKTPSEAGNIFEGDDSLKEKHVEATNEGETNVNEHLDTCNHFIAFVEHDGFLYELDGRKNRPVPHGPTSPDTFLEDACKIVHTFIQREPENVNAGMIVLAAKPDEEEMN
jgi:ubiquitin carboxyl-terminal hydrolase L3